MENLDLAKLVLKTAETEYQKASGLFCMGQWAVQFPCGTSACLAGHTLLQHGGYELVSPHVLRRLADEELIVTSVIGDEAQQLLGMSRDERYYRFRGDIFLRSNDKMAISEFRTLIAESEA